MGFEVLLFLLVRLLCASAYKLETWHQTSSQEARRLAVPSFDGGRHSLDGSVGVSNRDADSGTGSAATAFAAKAVAPVEHLHDQLRQDGRTPEQRGRADGERELDVGDNSSGGAPAVESASAPASLMPTNTASRGDPAMPSEAALVLDSATSEERLLYGSKVSSIILLVFIVGACVPVFLQHGFLPIISLLLYLACLVGVRISVKDVFKSGFAFPYAITAFHMLCTAVVASVLHRPTREGARSTFLISIVKAAALAFSNTSLIFGTAAFVSILGSCVPATTHLIEVVRHGRTTVPCCAAVLAVCVGAMITVKGDEAFSLLSMVLGLCACFCRSLKTVWSHDLLEAVLSPCQLAAWCGIWSFCIMLIATFVKEGMDPFRRFPMTTTQTKIGIFGSSIIATVLNIIMCTVLKKLGPFQLNVYGQLEVATVLMCSVAFHHESVSFLQWVGCILITLGCLAVKFTTMVSFFTITKEASKDAKNVSP